MRFFCNPSFCLLLSPKANLPNTIIQGEAIREFQRVCTDLGVSLGWNKYPEGPCYIDVVSKAVALRQEGEGSMSTYVC